MYLLQQNLLPKNKPICSSLCTHSRKTILLHILWKTFFTSGHLKIHILIHTGEKAHACEHCKMTFYDRSAFTRHQSTHRKTNQHKCDQCGKYFAQKRTLKNHLNTHQSETPFKCLLCGKFLSSGNLLALHHKSHTGEKLYGCNICSKSFAVCSKLRRHQLTHSAVKQHGCEVCQKKFLLRETLKQHMVVHTKLKSYECDQCKKRLVYAEASQTIIKRFIKRFKIMSAVFVREDSFLEINSLNTWGSIRVKNLLSVSFVLARVLKRTRLKHTHHFKRKWQYDLLHLEKFLVAVPDSF